MNNGNDFGGFNNLLDIDVDFNGDNIILSQQWSYFSYILSKNENDEWIIAYENLLSDYQYDNPYVDIDSTGNNLLLEVFFIKNLIVFKSIDWWSHFMILMINSIRIQWK